MEWTTRIYDNSEVDAAGLVLAKPATDPFELEHALAVVNNFRAAHNFPLNTFQTTLRYKTKQFVDSLIAQRIKRLPAIRHKLQKHTANPIALSEMQDIGGCRAIVKNMTQLRKLVQQYLESDLKHELVKPINDYIAQPRYSGYRGVHLVYKYYSDKKADFNGLKIEMQLRTQAQHSWATAVEIVGFFRQELLKSSEGDQVWKRFFKLMASELAVRERCPTIPGTPSSATDLRNELGHCVEHLDALTYLHAFGRGLQDILTVDTERAHYFLLELDALERRLKVTGYRLNARIRATADYAEVEKMLLGSAGAKDVVLVSAKSIDELKRAYTNYFLDMSRFTATVEDALGVERKPVGAGA